MTALMNAVEANDVARVRALIEQGHDVDALTSSGDAPLVIAAYKGYDEIVRLLLEAGASTDAVDPGMKATALHAAAYAGRTGAARLLIQHGIDVDRQGPYNGYTALHDAIWQNNIDTARVIVDGGADLTLKSHEGETPLQMARKRNRGEIVRMLQEKENR